MEESKRLVHCAKLDKDLPGLSKPPFSSELGEKIYNSISEEAWQDWCQNYQLNIINEYRLNLSYKVDYERLLKEMCLFLNISC